MKGEVSNFAMFLQNPYWELEINEYRHHWKTLEAKSVILVSWKIVGVLEVVKGIRN